MNREPTRAAVLLESGEDAPRYVVGASATRAGLLDDATRWLEAAIAIVDHESFAAEERGDSGLCRRLHAAEELMKMARGASSAAASHSTRVAG